MKDINKILTVKNGDFDLLDDSLFQNQDIIINCTKGNIINNLLLGVGIMKYLNGPSNLTTINKNVRTELKKDKIEVIAFNIINNEIYISSKDE